MSKCVRSHTIAFASQNYDLFRLSAFSVTKKELIRAHPAKTSEKIYVERTASAYEARTILSTAGGREDNEESDERARSMICLYKLN